MNFPVVGPSSWTSLPCTALLLASLGLLAACDRPAETGPPPEQELYEDAWTEAGKRVEISKPPAFDPPVDPASIKVAITKSHVSQDYRDYQPRPVAGGLANVAIGPLLRELSSLRGDAFQIKSEIDECRGCAGYIDYVANLEMPTAESYRLTLSVTSADQTREWAITRGFRELNVRPGHPNPGERVSDLVKTSISLDMEALGLEACTAIIRQTCTGKLKP